MAKWLEEARSPDVYINAQELLASSPPGAIVVELLPHAIEDTGYDGGALQLLQQIYEWGYTHVSHSG